MVEEEEHVSRNRSKCLAGRYNSLSSKFLEMTIAGCYKVLRSEPCAVAVSKGVAGERIVVETARYKGLLPQLLEISVLETTSSLKRLHTTIASYPSCRRDRSADGPLQSAYPCAKVPVAKIAPAQEVTFHLPAVASKCDGMLVKMECAARQRISALVA